MFKNNLKIAYRNLVKNKFISSINIAGLSLGLTVAMLIGLFIHHELSYDKWMGEKENIYRVYRDWSAGGGGNVVWTPDPLAEKLMTDFPEVKAASGLGMSDEVLTEYRGQQFYLDKMAMVDSTFFGTVPIPFAYGNPEEALNQPNGLVISKELSQRIFGDANPVGEFVELFGGDEYRVTGVFDLASNISHLAYDSYIRFTWDSPNWTGNNRATYVHLAEHTDIAAFQGKISTEVNKMIEREYAEHNFIAKPEDFPVWKLQPLTDIHLYSSEFMWNDDNQGNVRNLYIFLIIGCLILTVAVVNYINLSTAQATKRAKEVGVRKTVGALRSHLTGQFLTETFFQSFLALGVAFILVELLLPIFNTITDRELAFLGENIKWMIFPALGLTALVALLAGFYPALVMSSFRPVEALRANFLKTNEKGLFRKVLVSGQFAITIALLVVMAFVYRQVNFMMEHELGFQSDQVLNIPLNLRDSHRKVEALRTEIANISGVRSVTTSSQTLGNQLPDWAMKIEGQDDNVNPNVLFADHEYLKTLGLEMKEGRFLSPDIAADSVNNFVVNEAFVENHHLENPIGTPIKFSFEKSYGQIVGVVKDFHFRGLSHRVRPLAMSSQHDRWYVSLKVSTDDLPTTIASLKNIWPRIEPKHPLRYTFLDEHFNEQYAEQQRFGNTMLYATLLTLFIAMLGLFGLTAFNVERRTKEIGIRKVLGASTTGIVALLSKDFLKLVVIAFVVAVPVSWYASNLWLEDFAFRTDLSWWVFAVAGLAAVAVAFFTVGFQSMRAAMANPVESLRSE